MIRRAALALLLLVFTGVVGLFAAGHFGIPLPWETATTTDAPDPASKDREQAAAPIEADEPAEQAAGTPESIIDETVAALQDAPPEAKPEPGSVALDVSRIAPDSFSVFAGRAEPNSYVTVTENGKPAGTVRADANGEWSLVTDHKFASADPNLVFEASSTPPPEPEPAPTTTAQAPPSAEQPATAAASPSADTVAGDVMRKFENLVSEARETAARETEEKEKAEQARKAQEAEQERQSATAVAEAKPDVPKPDVPAIAAAPDTPAATQPAPESGASTRSEAAADAADAVADSADTETADADSADTDSADTGTRVAAAEQREDTPASIPVPIMFVYNEATLTSEGKRAADLLLEYLTLKRLAAVELTGHADERGSLEYNFDLSRERLETVSQLLKDGGYTGKLTLTPKGKTEPFMGVDRKQFRGEALHQLDRRVELRVTR